MTKRPVPPFFGNTKDNMHCLQASLKMILKHFESEKNYSWAALDRLTGQKKGKWTWPIDMLANLHLMGYDVHMIDPFDYKKFLRKKEKYFYEIWSKEIADAQLLYSDIPHVLRSYKMMPKDMDCQVRDATIGDIRSYLKKGYLVETGVNSAALNRRKGYAGHSVVIYDINKTHVFLHDSGLPPQPARKVTLALFKKAWNTKGINVIRKP